MVCTSGDEERPWLIDRPRLLKRLSASHASAIALVAPAGYGKSTLAGQFVRATAESHVWFACTHASRDVERLAIQLTRTVAATRLLPTQERAHLAGEVKRAEDWTESARLLGDALESWPPNVWLILDDYEQVVGAGAAEEFLGQLVLRAGIRTVVASRLRPAWMTTRRVTYGEVADIGARELAMTPTETHSLLQVIGQKPHARLIALVDGWPAALTIAASAAPHADTVAGILDDFVAEEVFRPLSQAVLVDMSLLAGLSSIEPVVVKLLLGEVRARRSISAAREAGIIERVAADRYYLHPLVRDYLRRQPLDSEAIRGLGEAADRLAGSGRWTDLFDLVARTNGEDLLAVLLTKGVRVALDEGSAPSVRNWLDYARRNRMCAPLVSLGEAELALRNGYYAQSEILGAEVAARLGRQPAARTWAFLIAGRAAHLGGREQKAVDYYRAARSSATTDLERREADWGELKGAIDLELPEAVSLLDRLRGSEQATAADRVEVASRSLMLGARLGSLESLDEARTVVQVVPYIADPVARNSFRNTFAYACAIAGEYADALETLTALEADAESQRLLFALPYVACARAVVYVARREFDAAFDELTAASLEGRRVADTHVLGMCAAIRGRALVALGRFDEAATESAFRHPSLIKSMHAELLVTQSLALACSGDDRAARELSEQARALSAAVEVTGIANCIDAIGAARAGSADAEAATAAAAAFAMDSRYVDGLIAAYRGFPELARRIAANQAHASWLMALMERANDYELAQIVGLGRVGGENHLSRREAEVFGLLRQGLSNREIGARLFITEDTAKQHVHRIFRKLGVKTRTEAALKVPPNG